MKLVLHSGKLIISDDSFFSSEKKILSGQTIDQGITFGTGIGSQDLLCEIYGGVFVNILQGSIHYKNINT